MTKAIIQGLRHKYGSFGGDSIAEDDPLLLSIASYPLECEAEDDDAETTDEEGFGLLVAVAIISSVIVIISSITR